MWPNETAASCNVVDTSTTVGRSPLGTRSGTNDDVALVNDLVERANGDASALWFSEWASGRST